MLFDQHFELSLKLCLLTGVWHDSFHGAITEGSVLEWSK